MRGWIVTPEMPVQCASAIDGAPDEEGNESSLQKRVPDSPFEFTFRTEEDLNASDGIVAGGNGLDSPLSRVPPEIANKGWELAVSFRRTN
jgi:hypothetical protein